jgi:hypothetical protein
MGPASLVDGENSHVEEQKAGLDASQGQWKQQGESPLKLLRALI